MSKSPGEGPRSVLRMDKQLTSHQQAQGNRTVRAVVRATYLEIKNEGIY